jgi:hypothetical protein
MKLTVQVLSCQTKDADNAPFISSIPILPWCNDKLNYGVTYLVLTISRPLVPDNFLGLRERRFNICTCPIITQIAFTHAPVITRVPSVAADWSKPSRTKPSSEKLFDPAGYNGILHVTTSEEKSRDQMYSTQVRLAATIGSCKVAVFCLPFICN